VALVTGLAAVAAGLSGLVDLEASAAPSAQIAHLCACHEAQRLSPAETETEAPDTWPADVQDVVAASGTTPQFRGLDDLLSQLGAVVHAPGWRPPQTRFVAANPVQADEPSRSSQTPQS
jgi:hypothetical protein